ncbi:hypothetical protein O181_132976, partial [Austropuccinia psidii MF-1]|nr:hypothetical protein [Austropuccinia psidii MF-1]
NPTVIILVVNTLITTSIWTQPDIVTETSSETGAKDSRCIKLNLTIEVNKVLYSGAELRSAKSAANDLITPTQSSSNLSNGASLQLSNQISQQNKHIKLGAFNTLDLEPNREFTIIKGPDGWDLIHMERLSDSLDASKSADIGVILADKSGKATICLIGTHATFIKQRIKVPAAKKKKSGLGSDKVMEKFHKQIYDTLTKNFNFAQL